MFKRLFLVFLFSSQFFPSSYAKDLVSSGVPVKRLYFATKSFTGYPYLTDGTQVIKKRNGKFGFSHIVKSNPKAYELALEYEKYARYSRNLLWATLGTFLGVAVLIGEVLDVEVALYSGLVLSVVGLSFGIYYGGKASHYFYKSINTFNGDINSFPEPQKSIDPEEEMKKTQRYRPTGFHLTYTWQF